MAEQNDLLMLETMNKFVCDVFQFATKLSKHLSPTKTEYKTFHYRFGISGDAPEGAGFDFCEIWDRDRHQQIMILSRPTGTICSYMGKEPEQELDRAYNNQPITEMEIISRRICERRRWYNTNFDK